MKKLLAALPLLCWSVLASAYTIDFEEFAPGTDGPVISGGYIISGSGTCSSGSCPVAGVTSDNTFISVGEQDFFGAAAHIVVERADGQAFALYSLDVVFALYDDGITGETAAGDIITGGLLGQGDWLNIVSFRYSVATPMGDLAPAILELDNIVVSVVPIPAAVWLFGSGLIGLGFLGRRQFFGQAGFVATSS